MKKLSHLLPAIKRMGEKELPTILSGTAIIGLGGTCILVAKETPEAQKKNTFLEKAWAYKWSIASGVATAACVIFADRINVKRLTDLAIDYNMLADHFSEYKDASNRLLEKAGLGAGAVAAEIAATKDIPEMPEMDEDGEPLRLVYDAWLHDYYYCSLSKLYLADLVLQEEYDIDGYARTSKFYAEAGIKIDGEFIAEVLSDDIGWDYEYLLDENEVPFVPVTIDENWTDPKTGKKCVYFDWPLEPRIYR